MPRPLCKKGLGIGMTSYGAAGALTGGTALCQMSTTGYVLRKTYSPRGLPSTRRNTSTCARKASSIATVDFSRPLGIAAAEDQPT